MGLLTHKYYNSKTPCSGFDIVEKVADDMGNIKSSKMDLCHCKKLGDGSETDLKRLLDAGVSLESVNTKILSASLGDALENIDVINSQGVENNEE